jgi:hypothetical protein
LLLRIGEFGRRVRAFLADKAIEIVVLFVEGSPPVSDGGKRNFESEGDVVILSFIENHFAALQTLDFLRG